MLFAIVFEQIYRLGLGNIVASVIGFLTLLVAHFLSLDGDTFVVLQAVLDTQFWLCHSRRLHHTRLRHHLPGWWLGSSLRALFCAGPANARE